MGVNSKANPQGDSHDKFDAASRAERHSHAVSLASEAASDGSEFADREAAKKALTTGLGK